MAAIVTNAHIHFSEKVAQKSTNGNKIATTIMQKLPNNEKKVRVKVIQTNQNQKQLRIISSGFPTTIFQKSLIFF